MEDAQTVRVRIAVMINGKGEWNAEGWCDDTTGAMLEGLRNTFDMCGRMDEHTVVRFVEADVPIPRATATIEGKAIHALITILERPPATA